MYALSGTATRIRKIFSPSDDLAFPVRIKNAVSATHARLEKKDGRLLVTDLGSTNGTYINERRLNPGFPIPIDPGSLLIFGLHPSLHPIQ